MEDLYAKAVQELSAIDAKLAELVPLQKRRAQLLPFVELGLGLFAGVSTASATGQLLGFEAQLPPRATYGIARRRISTTKDRIISIAQAVITERGAPASTADIIKALNAAEVTIGSADKVLAVSSVLSREKDKFKSDRAAGGWTLVHPHKEEPPQGVDAPAGA